MALAFKDRCSKDAKGLHLTNGGNPFQCILCGAVDQEAIERSLIDQKKMLEAGARTAYQAQVQGVALQLLQMFMTQNMMRDLGQIVRDSNTVKAPRELSELLDLSITGAIHFVTEVSKLKPRTEYVEQHSANSPTLLSLFPGIPSNLP